MVTTAQRHLDAIKSGMVTKSNIIGIRKGLRHVDRIRAGWSGNRSSVTPQQADMMESEIISHRPTVLGELHHSGVKLLRSPRYAKRFNVTQTAIIHEKSGVRFELVRFDRLDGNTMAPVYCVVSFAGRFCFRNIPWQSAFAAGLESGPVIVEDN